VKVTLVSTARRGRLRCSAMPSGPVTYVRASRPRAEELTTGEQKFHKMVSRAQADVISTGHCPEGKLLVGQSLRRTEDLSSSRAGAYLDDLKFPKMLYAAFVRSPHAHQRS